MHNTHSAGRDTGLDLLRAAASIRVFLWHATGFAALTFVGAIPVMFWLNGMLLAASMNRHGVFTTLRSRAKRLLIPYWGFAAVMTTLMAWKDDSYEPAGEMLSWLLPLGTPEGAAWQAGWITEPLWYLRTYAWLLMLSPLIAWAIKMRTKTTLLTLAAGTFALEITLGIGAWAVQDLLTYGVFFAAGIAATNGWAIARTNRRILGALAAVGAATLWQLARPLDGVVNNSHSIHLLVGIGTLALVAEFRGKLSEIADGRRTARFVAFMRERSLTFYLWHAPITGAAWIAAGRYGIESGAVRTLFAVTVGLIATLAATSVLGVLEDLGAGKNGLRLPAARTLVAVSAAGIVIATGVSLPASGHNTLPPAPSRAPEAVDFTIESDEAFLFGATQSANPVTLSGGESLQRPENPLMLGLPFIGGEGRERANQPANGRTNVRTGPGTQNNTGGRKPTDPTTSTKPADPTTSTKPVNNQPTTTEPIPRPATPPVDAWGALAPEMAPEKTVQIDAAIAAWMKTRPTLGVEVAVLSPGRWRYVSGYSEDGATTKASDRIAIHSITKTFTAALILRAIEDGKIRLDDRVGTLKVAPWFTLGEQITVGQLLSHRSGLVTYTDTKAYKNDWQSIDGWEPALRGALEEGLAFTPGSKQVYSSTNFIVLGLLAAQIYGRDIETLIETELLQPLGLDRTTVGRPYPGSPGTGTGNMTAHITDIARWATAMWRDKNVLGQNGNQIASFMDPAGMLGYGTFGYCPCQQYAGRTIPAAIGGNGAESTMRYYQGIDTVIVLRTPITGPLKGVEELVTDILRISNS